MTLGRASFFLPVALIVVLVAIFLTARPFDYLSKGAPPGEDLTVEHIRLDETGIHATVRAAGSEPMTIAQIQVDGAYRTFTQDPAGPIGYLGTARIHIPYPWIDGEAHHIVFLTSTGTGFEHSIDIAVATTGTTASDLLGLAMAGLFVGIIPVMIGFAFYPVMMSFGEAGREFALALTVGLLAYLLLDTIGEGLEAAEEAAASMNAELIVWLSALLTTLALLAIGRRGGKPPEGVALAYFIAIGIGVHNLGEGLAIGASFAVGEIALASFLILGFALHNVTEGIAISAPIRREAMSPMTLLWLAVIAGGPAIPGAMIGGQSISPIWTALAFGIGAGAILQVMIEVGGLFLRREREPSAPWHSTANLVGFTAGIAVMYVTAFVVRG